MVKEYYPNHPLEQIELRKEEKEGLEKFGNVYIDDFLNYEKDKIKKYKTIITNPPFSLAKEFLEKCFEISDEDTEIIMLLRLAYLESKKRHDFWQKHPVKQLYVLSDRPSFTGQGTDATAYAWFVWSNKEQLIKVI